MSLRSASRATPAIASVASGLTATAATMYVAIAAVVVVGITGVCLGVPAITIWASPPAQFKLCAGTVCAATSRTYVDGDCLRCAAQFPAYGCAAGPCAAGEVLVYGGGDCGVCSVVNGTGGGTTLTNAGSGASAVVVGVGAALSTAGFTGTGLAVAARVGNNVNYDVTLPAPVKGVCSVAACNPGEFLAYNGSCYACAGQALPPTGYLPLCGACNTGDVPRLNANATCWDCAPLALTSAGGGTSLVAGAQAVKSLLNSSDVSVLSTATDVSLALAPDVMRICSVGTCTVGFTAVYNGSCFLCLSVNGSTSAGGSIATAGAGASLVQDGVGPDFVLRSVLAVGLATVTQNTDDLTINVTLPATVAGLCSAVAPACASNERLSYNGTCYACVALTAFVIPASYLPVCGACSAGDQPTLAANGTCWNCAPFPAAVKPLCSAIAPACASGERMSYNGSCFACSALPNPSASYLPLCGSCSAADTPSLAANGTCWNCAPLALSSAGAGSSLVSSGAGLVLKSLLNSTDVTVSSTASDLSLVLSSAVMKMCAGACTFGYSAVNNGSCFVCANVTGSSSLGSIVSAGGASLVQDGLGPDYILRGIAVAGFLTVAQNANDVTINGTLPATLAGLCSAVAPACAATERLTYNGTCYTCSALPAIPATYLPLCGACSVGNQPTLASNGSCWNCAAPTVFALSSAGTGVSLVSNATTGAVKSLGTGSGLSLGSTTTDVTVNLAPDVMRLCNATCAVGYVATWNTTCFTCTNATGGAGTSLSSAGGGASLVVVGSAPAFSIRSVVAGANIAVTQNADDVTLSVPLTGYLPLCGGCMAADVLHLSTNGTCMACAPDKTINSTGAGVSLVNNPAGYSVKSALAGSGIAITGNAADVTFAVTSSVVQLCTGSAACAAGAFISYNGTCVTCIASPTTPSSYAQLCGACAVGDQLRLGANGTCFDCFVPALTSTGVGVSLIYNGPGLVLRDLTAAGVAVVNSTGGSVEVFAKPVVANTGVIGGFGTTAALSITTSAIEQVVLEGGFDETTAMSVVLNAGFDSLVIYSIVHRVHIVPAGGITVTSPPPHVTAYNIVFIRIAASASVAGPFALRLSSATSLGPVGEAAWWGGGSFACEDSSGFTGPYGAAHYSASDSVAAGGNIPFAGSWDCTISLQAMNAADFF
jgi:hypothetical protein